MRFSVFKQNLLSVYAIIGLSLMGLFVFYVAYPYRTVEYKIKPLPVLYKDARPGGTQGYVVSMCKYNDLTGVLTRQFVNSYIIALSPSTVDLPRGCHEKISYLQVPDFAPDGKYKLIITVEYQVNPIRKVKTTVETEEFTVLKI